MTKIDAVLDWLLIVTSPLAIASVWYSENVPMLRMYALFWFVFVISGCIRDRAWAWLKRGSALE